MTALIGTRRQPILATDSNTAQRAIGGIAVGREAAVVDIAGQRHPAGEGIADGNCEVGAPEQLWFGRVEPLAKRIEQRSGEAPRVLRRLFCLGHAAIAAGCCAA